MAAAAETAEPDRRVLRRMGYYADSRGIARRYIDQEGGWDDHISHCRDCILKALRHRHAAKVAVLGSGWLTDFPFDEVVDMPVQLQLYDLVHPPQVLHLISRHPNVQAIAADITGGTVMAVWHAVKAFRKTGIKTAIRQICDVTFIPPVRPDFIISLNILSQLGDLPGEYLRRHVPYTEDELSHFSRLLQQNHLKLLSSCPSLLITDFEEITTSLTDGSATCRQMVQLQAELPEEKILDEWKWDFDRNGAYSPGKSVHLRVAAVDLCDSGQV